MAKLDFTADTQAWTNNSLRNIREFGSLATSMANPVFSQIGQSAGMMGQRMQGDIEAALQGRGARSTGVGGLAALSAKGAASAMVSQQRQQFMQQLYQTILQGGLQMGSEQLSAHTALQGIEMQMPSWWEKATQGLGVMGQAAGAIMGAI